MNENTVEIVEKHYEYLLECENKLLALEAAGVDNWVGYSHAMEIMEGLEDG